MRNDNEIFTDDLVRAFYDFYRYDTHSWAFALWSEISSGKEAWSHYGINSRYMASMLYRWGFTVKDIEEWVEKQNPLKEWVKMSEEEKRLKLLSLKLRSKSELLF